MTGIRIFFSKHGQLFVYGCSLAVLLFFLKWLQWKFLIIDNSLDIYIGLMAAFFTALGIWIANQLTETKVKTIVIEKEVMVQPAVVFEPNEAVLKEFNFTRREWEVLQLMSKGMSNAEIAGDLFLSLSTVKTHVSNLLVKMDVKSRVKAVEKAKRLKITP